MSFLSIGFLGFVLILVCFVVYIAVVFNQLVKNKNIVKEAWSGIDVQLKQRHELVPSLLKVVSGYMKYEKTLLENITNMRSSFTTTKSNPELEVMENNMTNQLRQIFVSVEDYPDLKADENFLELQQELARIEDILQHARRYYNGAVRINNIFIESFPSNIIAGLFGFKVATFFQINETEKVVPNVQL